MGYLHDCYIYECECMVKISSDSDKDYPIGNGVKNPTLEKSKLWVFKKLVQLMELRTENRFIKYSPSVEKNPKNYQKFKFLKKPIFRYFY